MVRICSQGQRQGKHNVQVLHTADLYEPQYSARKPRHHKGGKHCLNANVNANSPGRLVRMLMHS